MSKQDEAQPKRSLHDVLEELCPGVGQRNRPSWAKPLPPTEAPIEPMMTCDEDDEPAPQEPATVILSMEANHAELSQWSASRKIEAEVTLGASIAQEPALPELPPRKSDAFWF